MVRRFAPDLLWFPCLASSLVAFAVVSPDVRSPDVSERFLARCFVRVIFALFRNLLTEITSRSILCESPIKITSVFVLRGFLINVTFNFVVLSNVFLDDEVDI